MNKKILLTSVVILVIAVVGYSFINQGGQAKNIAKAASSAKTINTVSSGKTVTFSVTASNFQFDPTEIIVKQGDNVVINVTGKDATHSLVIRDYNINEVVNPGETKQLKFVADKTGTFTFFCSVPCGEGHSDMRGKLIVQP